MKSIQFSSNSSQRIYNGYIERCRRALKILNEEDREECLLEINSHIYEYLEDNKGTDEMENILNITERLGAPEETLKEAVASKKVAQAVRTFNPKYLFQALLLNIKNGFIYVLLFILSLFLISFPVLIIAKLISPKTTGLFVGHNKFILGYTNLPQPVPEVLGSFFIPAMLLLAVIFYCTILFILKIKNTIK